MPLWHRRHPIMCSQEMYEKGGPHTLDSRVQARLLEPKTLMSHFFGENLRVWVTPSLRASSALLQGSPPLYNNDDGRSLRFFRLVDRNLRLAKRESNTLTWMSIQERTLPVKAACQSKTRKAIRSKGWIAIAAGKCWVPSAEYFQGSSR